jgi:hypothetical protein
VHSPNGVGLSPDGSILYYAETHTGRVFRRRVAEPGVLAPLTSIVEIDPWALLCGLPGMQLLDSLAIDADGWVCVGTLINGAVTAIAPNGEALQQVFTDESLTTNSASAEATCAPPTSRCRPPADWRRWLGRDRGCASPISERSGGNRPHTAPSDSSVAW